MTGDAERLYERLLVVRCQTGDEAAYRELVGRFGPRLEYFLRKLVGRDARADDIAQEVWIAVFAQLPKLRDAGAFTTWLYRIAHNKAMLDARRNGRMHSSTHEVAQIASDEEESFSREDAARIHAALDELEPPQREVLVLRFLEDLSYDEISEIVACPVGTVRSRIHYAKVQLRRILDDENQ